ncbi:MAG TPA: AsmA-like C-terminal region-containing protein, partial [Woeseiaceae bacterium]|nr:AsmA-like C-terminal region-containing protein [Woeseiaceae bacterium]
LRADSAGGRIEIDSEGLVFYLPAELPEPVILDDATGTIIWRRNADGVIILSDSIHVRNADLNSQTSLQINAPADGSSTTIDLESDWSLNDIGSVRRYLPVQAIKPPLYRWLTGALVSGGIPRATTRIVGPLRLFPFEDGQGIFRIDAVVTDAVLRYSDLWPAASNMDLDIVVDRTRLYSHKNFAVNAGNTVQNAIIEIADLRKPVLEINAFATGTLESIRQFSRQSPIAAVFGGHLDRLEVGGDASFDLRLVYPIANRESYEFETRIRASNGSVRIQGFPAPVTELNGAVVISRDDIRSEQLFGRFLDEPVDIELRKAGEQQPAYNVIATATGRASAGAIVNQLGVPLGDFLEGSTPFVAQLMFPARQEAQNAPFRIAVESELQGLALDLPPPFSKAADEPASLAFSVDLPGDDRIESTGNYRQELLWSMSFERSDEGWDFDRGVLSVNGEAPGLADTRGLHVRGRMDELRLDDWLALARRDAGSAGLGDRIRAIDLTIDRLDAIGQHLTSQRVVVNRSAQDWMVELDGDHAVGTLSIPYDFSSGRPISLDMQLLTLPGKEMPTETEPDATDPRRLPAVSLLAEEFSFGERHLGNFSALFEKTPRGLESQDVRAKDASFTIEGSAGWIIDEQDEAGQSSFVNVRLVSNDVARTMQRLNYEPGIDGQDMEILLDLHWSGGPRADFLENLNGDVTVRFGPGQLNEVEPGPGRVFGLMSIVALPRRLSLDFSDVFEKGFGFDEITGRFKIEQGNAYTCDLSLKGPAADVGVVGRAGLFSRDYSQIAVVSANVGNTLPVVGAVVAGPQVAAALLIFSQIFKKPLQEMGQVYYAIDGSWDNPAIDNTSALRFAESSALAGCVDTAD